MPDNQPTYIIPYATTGILENGILDDPAWELAPWTERFRWIDGGDLCPYETKVKAIYSSEKLSFAFWFDYPEFHKEKEWNPDFPQAAEIFIDIDGTGENYLEYAISPQGGEHSSIWHGNASIAGWHSDLRIDSLSGVSKRINPDGTCTVIYTVSFTWQELARISPSVDGMPCAGTTWRVNFSRVESGRIHGDYSWSVPGYYYMHVPNTFGVLVFQSEQEIRFEPVANVNEEIAGNDRFRKKISKFFCSASLDRPETGSTFVISKSWVAGYSSDGSEEWAVVGNGLPQYCRYMVPSPSGVYVSGSGNDYGVVCVDDSGGVKRVPISLEQMSSTQPAKLHPLGRGLAVASVGERYQIIDGNVCRPVIDVGACISCIIPVGEELHAVGTSAGVQLYSFDGMKVSEEPVAGGIVYGVNRGDMAIFAATRGLYSLSSMGEFGFYPEPIRVNFDFLHDAGDRFYASYCGGFMIVEGNKVSFVHEPAGAYGFKVSGAATGEQGDTVFCCYSGTGVGSYYYGSSTQTPFLLIHKAGKWERISPADGIPGELRNICCTGPGRSACATSPGLGVESASTERTGGSLRVITGAGIFEIDV